jgi:hypothetical protein
MPPASATNEAPDDEGIDRNGEGDEQDADGVGAHSQLLEDSHEQNECDEPASIRCVDLGQVIDKAGFVGHFPPLFLKPGFVVDLVL